MASNLTLVRNPICVICKRSHFSHSTEEAKSCKKELAKSREMLGRQNFSDEVKMQILERQNGKCLRCGKYMSRPRFHHIGGRWGDYPENGAALHPWCHDEVHDIGSDF